MDVKEIHISFQLDVRKFHELFGLAISDSPTLDVSASERKLRKTLQIEEMEELHAAMDTSDLVGIADGIADLLYVTYAVAVAYGIDIDPVFAEVHRSNLSKVGGYKREDGKYMKPSTFVPPDVRGELLKQGWEG